MALSAVLTSNCNFRLFVFGILVLLLFDLTQCITTIHHDKPTLIRLRPTNSTIAPSERQKRLLPYYNFYLDQPLRYNHRQPPNIYIDANNYRVKAPQQNHVLSRPSKIQFTPFLDSNALAGPFVPIHKQPQQNVYTPPYQTKVPTNYDELYKLAQLKLLPHPESYSHNYKPVQNYRKPAAVQFIPVEEYQVESRPVMQPIKTVIQTYKPTEIEITTTEEQNSNPPQTIVEDSKRVPELTNQDFAHPITSEEHRQYEEDRGNYVADKRPANLPQQKPYQPVIKYQPIYQYVSAHKYKPTQNFLITPPPPPPVPPSPTTTTTKPTTEIPPTIVITSEPENPHSLNLILKQLQDSNTLPQTLTPDNIDNSIKTLVKILNSLKKQPKFAKPIVVVDENVDYEEANEAEEVEPEVVTQNFPAITESGGTPGKAGIDYPALSTIPKTNFNCKTQRYKGFFGDPDTNCQVWHYCDLNGGQASFLCPNGTIFSQVALTCDWWFNVKCASTPQLYVLNERLYKYILPLSPKFPEDYSGPLVDKYLALKFQEMEDKMRKEKKGKVEGASEEEANSETNEEKISEEEQDYVTTAEAETAQ